MIMHPDNTDDGETRSPMPDNVTKPNHMSPRYYKIVDGKSVFNQKRWTADNAFYKKWLEWKNNNQ